MNLLKFIFVNFSFVVTRYKICNYYWQIISFFQIVNRTFISKSILKSSRHRAVTKF